jgi:hypothetical protein
MAGLMDLLNSDLGKQIISSVSGSAGTNEGETSSVLASVLPALVGGMMNNAQTTEGQGGLLGALLGGKHGGLLDNLSGMLGGDVQEEGGKILGHVLGDNQETVQNQVSQNTGVSSDKIAMIMKIAAPILMAFLARKAQASGLDNSGAATSGGGLTDILGGLLGGGQAQQQAPAESGSLGGSILTSVLDQDGDGQIGIGDAVTAMSGQSKSGGGLLGGLLGKLFGKK